MYNPLHYSRSRLRSRVPPGSIGGEPIMLKFVIAGDDRAGKTSLTSVFLRGVFPEVYTYFGGIQQVEIHRDSNPKLVLAGVYDLSLRDEFNDRLRPRSYAQTDVFILCFSVEGWDSFHHVQSKWEPEIRHHCGNTPIVLVGCKKDLRDDPATVAAMARRDKVPVSFEEGMRMSQQIGAFRYCECSAIRGDSVKEVFESALQAAMAHAASQRGWVNFGKKAIAKCEIL
ncbi:transforming protein RhoA [Zopfochytrium polystomum]|nr:transforming protein RhoA [Zopfochytrium polystomum]